MLRSSCLLATVLLSLSAVFVRAQAPAPATKAAVPSPAAAPFKRNPDAQLSVVISPWDNKHTYTPISVPQGTELSFLWNGGHGVYLLPTSQCPDPGQYTPGVAGQYLLAGGLSGTTKTSIGNNYTAFLETPGSYYFACQVGDHCSEDGQMQIVTVVASRTANMDSLQ